MKAEREASLGGEEGGHARGMKAWFKEVWAGLKPNWFLFVYMYNT